MNILQPLKQFHQLSSSFIFSFDCQHCTEKMKLLLCIWIQAWEFAHAWTFMKLCALTGLVMTAIIMVYSLVNASPLKNYDVINDDTTLAEGTLLKTFL